MGVRGQCAVGAPSYRALCDRVGVRCYLQRQSRAHTVQSINPEGAGPAVPQHDSGCPTRGSFTGGLQRTPLIFHRSQRNRRVGVTSLQYRQDCTTGGLAQPYPNMTRDAPPVAVSRVGCSELPSYFIGHSEIVASVLRRRNAERLHYWLQRCAVRQIACAGRHRRPPVKLPRVGHLFPLARTLASNIQPTGSPKFLLEERFSSGSRPCRSTPVGRRWRE